MDDGAVGPADGWPFVGRRDQVERAVAVLADRTAGGIVVHGAPGAGRSRFLAEVLARVEAGGRTTRRALGSGTSGAVPFGAVAHLLPPTVLLDGADGPVDPVRVLAGARQAFASADERPVVAVDDAHLLDALSLLLLGQLVGEQLVSLVLTVRDGDGEPDLLSSLWHTGRLERLDLTELADDEVATLLHLGLGAPVDGRTARLLTEASAGNPLVLRELVRSAADGGALAEIGGVWRLTGELPAARRAVDLVAGRLAQVPPAARPVLDLLALVGPTPLDLAEELAEPEALEQLEADGLLTVTDEPGDGGTTLVALAQRAVGDAVREDLPTLRRRRILRDHAERVAAWPGRRPEDDLRIAGWQLDAGVAADPEALERAATLARHAEDFATTARLAEAAHRARPTLRTAVLWGDACYELSDWDGSEAVFAAAEDLPGNAFDRLRLVGSRGTTLLFGLLRSDEALARARTALAEVDAGHPRWLDGIEPEMLAPIRADLHSRVGVLQMYDGDPAAALATLGEVPPPVAPGDGGDDDLDTRDALRSRVLWAVGGVPALALGGRTGDAAALAASAFADHDRLGGEVGFSSVGTHLLTWALALQEHGELDQAEAVARAGYDATLASGAVLGHVWFGLSFARLALLRAQARTALRWCREAAAAAGASDWRGPQVMGLTGTAAALALAGDVDGSRRATAEAEAITGRFGFLLPERSLGPAWAAAAEGRNADGRAILRDAAALAADTGHLTVESWLRHEVVRLGGAGDEAARLRSLADGSDSALLALRADHAEAVATGDPQALEAAADRFEALGCQLVAAEALATAADLVRGGGAQRGANALATRAATAAARADGSRSTRLAVVDTVVPLTGREREVASLAAAGVPSKDIAERLYLSIRTVNNHLQNAYTKLGVTSRAELARALAVDAP